MLCIVPEYVRGRLYILPLLPWATVSQPLNKVPRLTNTIFFSLEMWNWGWGTEERVQLRGSFVSLLLRWQPPLLSSVQALTIGEGKVLCGAPLPSGVGQISFIHCPQTSKGKSCFQDHYHIEVLPRIQWDSMMKAVLVETAMLNPWQQERPV